MQKTSPLENNLAVLRKKRGCSAASLARAAGIGRQTVYAIEANCYIPNTAVALRLAQALEVTVDELFRLPGVGSPVRETSSKGATLLPGSGSLRAGQRVQLCRIGNRLVASPTPLVPWCLPDSDASVSGKRSSACKIQVRIERAEADLKNRIIVAGCDPAISLLARHVRQAGVELVLAQRNSSQALALLKQGLVHVAGTHLQDEASGESNLPEIARRFRKDEVAVISFAVWEQGIVTAHGNPKDIRGIENFGRKNVRIVNREPGAGSRILLDAQLARLKIDAKLVTGYDQSAGGHLSAAWQVMTGAADCCIATRAAALALGLGFVPLASERYDFVIRKRHMDMPDLQILFDALNRATFRRDLENAGGYETTTTGRRML
jgi:molybdate-binding protein/DNA-binding XRE family transcriptional regulator